MSAETNDLISLLDASVATADDCLTGTLIDFTDEISKPFQSALMTIAEVDDTFGLFSSKPRSNSAPETGSEATSDTPGQKLSKSVVHARKSTSEGFPNGNYLSKEGLLNTSLENGSKSGNSTVTSGFRIPGVNDGFINSTMGDYESDASRCDSYNHPIVASTPTIPEQNDDVFASPQEGPSSKSTGKSNRESQENNADSSVESDLLDIENLSTFSISDSSDTSGTEMKKGKFDFLSPRKVRSPASGLAKGKRDPSHLFHKNISITRRALSVTNSEAASDKISSITSSSTPLVMALRKKMSEKAAQLKLDKDNRNETKAPLLSRRYFPSSHTDYSISDNSKAPLVPAPDSSFTSPEPVKNEFVFPTPVKEYAETRKLTTPRASSSRENQGKSGITVTTPTKDNNSMSRNVTAIVTPSRRSIAKPSTPSSGHSGLTRQLSTPSRSQYGSTQSLTNRTPISSRHSFSTSSSSSGSDISRRLLTLDKVGPIPMKTLVTSIKPQATACVLPQSKGGMTKSSTLPRSKLQPMKALPLAGTGPPKSTSFRKAANTSITSHNQYDAGKTCVSAPVQRKFAPPIASSSPKPPPRSTTAYSLGTPPRVRKDNIRSSGYGQQAMNTSKGPELNYSRNSNPSPRLGEVNHPRYLPVPLVGGKSEMGSGDNKRPESNVDLNSSKIARASVPGTHYSRETKENNIRQLRKPTFGK